MNREGKWCRKKHRTALCQKTIYHSLYIASLTIKQSHTVISEKQCVTNRLFYKVNYQIKLRSFWYMINDLYCYSVQVTKFWQSNLLDRYLIDIPDTDTDHRHCYIFYVDKNLKSSINFKNLKRHLCHIRGLKKTH